MSILVGRTCTFDLGLHDTAPSGRAAEVAGEAALVFADGEDIGVVAASVITLLFDGEDGSELMAQPKAKPMTRAATTPAATPTRTTVLRRNAITAAFRPATEGNGAFRITRNLALPRLHWECAHPGTSEILARAASRLSVDPPWTGIDESGKRTVRSIATPSRTWL